MCAQPIRIGVIGAGSFASRRHLPDIQRNPDARLVALCRRDPEQLARMASHFGVATTYTDYQQMLAEEPLDAVLIATPHALHYPQAREALERGLHVLLEKPMAISASDARTLVVLARERRRQLVVALNPPYWAHCHLLRRWVAEGRLGHVESVALQHLGASAFIFGRGPLPDNLPGVVRPTLFRGDPDLAGGGVLIDSGSHLISELLWVTGLHVTRVRAQMDDDRTDLRTSVMMETAEGTPCVLTIRADSSHPQRRVHGVYYGSAATAVVDGTPFRLSLRDTGRDEEHVPEAGMERVPGPVDDFVAAIRGGREPAGSAEHGAHVAAVVEACYQSARSGRPEPVLTAD